MSFTVDSCRITVVMHRDFAGWQTIDLVLPQPIDPDDPLVVMAMERNRQILEAQARAAGPAGDLLA